MATSRGFVEQLEIGRAGQATAFLLHEDGSRSAYTIADLDADPERFNERLSKLGLLRDAMDRAEPVEVEYDQGEGSAAGGAGGSIERVRRLTRDALSRPRETDRASGLVVGLRMELVHSTEPADRGVLALLVDGAVQSFTVSMQVPERGMADAMVSMAREAQASGASLTVDYDTKDRVIVAMEMGSGRAVGGGGEDESFDGFVEDIAHTPSTDMMIVGLTTAPAFAGDGNVVPLEPFDPEERTLLVMRGAPEYALFEAALRDKLRVRVIATAGGPDRPQPEGGRPAATANVVGGDDKANVVNMAEKASSDEAVANANPAGAEGGGDPNAFAAGAQPYSYSFAGKRLAGAVGAAAAGIGLVRGAQLLAPLCSASRPVWIQVNRNALDAGPDAECAEGLPSSDLRPRTLREMDLPYRAEWIGIGCFNHGVYRFELALSCDFAILVDGHELCVHKEEGDGNVRFAHACLDGEHEVRVVLEGWRCRKQFDMDVYRIR